MSISAKKNDTWQTAVDYQVKVGSDWKSIEAAYTKVGADWKQYWPEGGAVYYVGGSFDGVWLDSGETSFSARNRIASYIPASGSWGPLNISGINSSVSKIVEYGDYLLVGGNFTAPRAYFLVATKSGAVQPVDLQLNGIVYDVLVDGDKAYICGAFTQSGSSPREGVLRLDLTTWTLDTVTFDDGSSFNNMCKVGSRVAACSTGFPRRVNLWDTDSGESLLQASYIDAGSIFPCTDNSFYTIGTEEYGTSTDVTTYDVSGTPSLGSLGTHNGGFKTADGYLIYSTLGAIVNYPTLGGSPTTIVGSVNAFRGMLSGGSSYFYLFASISAGPFSLHKITYAGSVVGSVDLSGYGLEYSGNRDILRPSIIGSEMWICAPMYVTTPAGYGVSGIFKIDLSTMTIPEQGHEGVALHGGSQLFDIHQTHTAAYNGSDVYAVTYGQFEGIGYVSSDIVYNASTSWYQGYMNFNLAGSRLTLVGTTLDSIFNDPTVTFFSDGYIAFATTDDSTLGVTNLTAFDTPTRTVLWTLQVPTVGYKIYRAEGDRLYLKLNGTHRVVQYTPSLGTLWSASFSTVFPPLDEITFDGTYIYGITKYSRGSYLHRYNTSGTDIGWPNGAARLATSYQSVLYNVGYLYLSNGSGIGTDYLEVWDPSIPGYRAVFDLPGISKFSPYTEQLDLSFGGLPKGTHLHEIDGAIAYVDGYNERYTFPGLSLLGSMPTELIGITSIDKTNGRLLTINSSITYEITPGNTVATGFAVVDLDYARVATRLPSTTPSFGFMKGLIQEGEVLLSTNFASNPRYLCMCQPADLEPSSVMVDTGTNDMFEAGFGAVDALVWSGGYSYTASGSSIVKKNSSFTTIWSASMNNDTGAVNWITSDLQVDSEGKVHAIGTFNLVQIAGQYERCGGSLVLDSLDGSVIGSLADTPFNGLYNSYGDISEYLGVTYQFGSFRYSNPSYLTYYPHLSKVELAGNLISSITTITYSDGAPTNASTDDVHSLGGLLYVSSREISGSWHIRYNGINYTRPFMYAIDEATLAITTFEIPFDEFNTVYAINHYYDSENDQNVLLAGADSVERAINQFALDGTRITALDTTDTVRTICVPAEYQ
jgi:hypothetical protein